MILRKVAEPPAEGDTSERSRRLGWLTLGLLAAVALALRCSDFLRNPALRVEDGREIFGHFYAHRDAAELLRFKAGYIPLIPNILGYVSARLPPAVIPYFLTLVPLLQAWLACVVFFSRSFRRYVPADEVRWVSCLVLALAPVGQYHLVCHTDYSIWTCLFLLFLLAAIPLPARWAIPTVVGMNLLLWTNPLSVITAPLTLVQSYRERRLGRRLLYAGILASHLAHLLWGVRTEARDRATTLHEIWAAVVQAIEHLGGQVLFRVMWGQRAFAWADKHAEYLFSVMVALALFGVGYALRRARRGSHLITPEGVLLVSALLVVPLLAVAVSKVGPLGSGANRYHYLSNLAAALAICWLLNAAMRRLLRFVPAAKFPPMIKQVLVAAPALLWAIWIAGDPKAYHDRNQENGPIVRRCFSRLAELESKHGGACGFRFRCDKKNDWDIDIKAPACSRTGG